MFKYSNSRLFTHIVFTEKVRKDTRDRKDTRGTKYTYYNGCFLIFLLFKSSLGLSTFNNSFTLFINMKIKDKTMNIQKKRKFHYFF